MVSILPGCSTSYSGVPSDLLTTGVLFPSASVISGTWIGLDITNERCPTYLISPTKDSLSTVISTIAVPQTNEPSGTTFAAPSIVPQSSPQTFQAVVTSSPSSPSSLISTAQVPSGTAATGLNSSTKIGIGLGVPLSVLILALLGFLWFHYRDLVWRSWLKYRGGTSTRELKFDDDEEKNNKGITDEAGVSKKPKGSEDQIHEIQDSQVPPYRRELEGSPGIRPQELPE